MPAERRVPIRIDSDIVTARLEGRAQAAQCEFSPGDQTVIAAAISEVARNILLYAQTGEILLKPVIQGERRGLVVIAEDHGPGIPDVGLALQDGYSTSGGLGLGLPGAKRLMDEFEITSANGKGTTITMKKWVS